MKAIKYKKEDDKSFTLFMYRLIPYLVVISLVISGAFIFVEHNLLSHYQGQYLPVYLNVISTAVLLGTYLSDILEFGDGKEPLSYWFTQPVYAISEGIIITSMPLMLISMV